MKTVKKISSIMLALALVMTTFVYTPAKAAEEKVVATAAVIIEAPFEAYYGGGDLVFIEESDLKDDFGIGLPTDGKDGATAVRAVAKAVRNYIMYSKNITDTKKANEEMKKYISYSNGFISAFSNDGKNWNTGTYDGSQSSALATAAAASGSAASGSAVSGSAAQPATGSAVTPAVSGKIDGFWMFFVDNMISEKLASETVLSSDYVMEIKFSWFTTIGDFGQPGYEMAGVGVIDDRMADGDKYHGYAQAGTKTTFAVKKVAVDPQTFKEASTYEAVPGATVSVYDENDEEITSAVADADGKFTLPKLATGQYTIKAWDPVKDATGKTYSKMSCTEYKILMVKKPGVPKKVKAKKKGKKVTVSWKKVKDASDYYEVYAAKKKNGKYKLVKDVNGKAKVTFKLAKSLKGMKFVKVRHYYVYETETGSNVRVFYGNFTKPAKIR